VVYTGTFSTGRRSIDALITALQRLKQEQRPIATHIELLIAGNLTATEQSVIESATIADMVTTVGIVPYHESLQHQVDADVLLLLVPPGAVSSTTTKLFEYLATGRPILALSAQSAAADLIRELDAGVVVPPEDPHTIAHACEQLYEQWKAGDLPTRADERVRRYDRRALTGELGALFDRMSV
jgi:glycosyltransferase involved in cell wall biosynthesis